MIRVQKITAGHPDFVPYNAGADSCPSVISNSHPLSSLQFQCTLEEGHAGNHVAHSRGGEVIEAIWDENNAKAD